MRSGLSRFWLSGSVAFTQVKLPPDMPLAGLDPWAPTSSVTDRADKMLTLGSSPEEAVQEVFELERIAL